MRRIVFATLALALSACSGGSSSSLGLPAPAPTRRNAAPSTAPAPSSTKPLVVEKDLPLVLVHGIDGEPANWKRVVDGLAPGRAVFRDAYVEELEALAPGSVSRRSVFAIGYYKRRASDPRYHAGRGSIGGCPAPRTDGLAGDFDTFYVDLVDGCVEAILRATGAPRVDLVGISMGGVVSRAYVRWRSGRGPGGESRVRRLLVLESPTRGLNDLEAFMLCLDGTKPPFMRRGEVAELARDYPAFSGKSFIAHLNDGFDAWSSSHGVVYGGMYGSGRPAINTGTFQLAVQAIQSYVAPSPAASSRRTSATASGSPSTSGASGLPAPLQAIQDGLRFIDLARFDLGKCSNEILRDDSDGFVRVPCASFGATTDFPSAVFDGKFLGLHIDRGQDDETIQYAVHTRELIRRFAVEGRTPRARLVSASARLVSGGGFPSWLLVEYELAGDGVSLQVRIEDESRWRLRQQFPLIPDDPRVLGAPAFDGKHRLRFELEQGGRRVVHLVFYDASGVAGEAGPFFFDAPRPLVGPELAPRTRWLGWSRTARTMSFASTAPAEFSWRLVGPSGPTSWSAWSTTGTFPVPNDPGELFVRSRHAANFGNELVEEGDPLTLSVVVDASGPHPSR